MKRSLLSFTIAVLLVGMAAATAFAAPRPPEADVFVDHQTANQNTNYNTQELRLSGSADPQGNCTATRTALLRFNLSDVTTTIGSAKLTLTTGNSAGSSGAAGRTVALLQVDNDTWNEATATYANTIGNGSVVIGAALGPVATLPGTDPIPSGQQVQFSGQPLVDFLNAQVAGNKLASVAVQFTSCATVSTQWFQDKDGGSVAATLELLSPTAVDMTTASAERTSWPLYAGLAAVALVVVAGVMMSRRRTA